VLLVLAVLQLIVYLVEEQTQYRCLLMGKQLINVEQSVMEICTPLPLLMNVIFVPIFAQLVIQQQNVLLVMLPIKFTLDCV
jgi:hypothetical protein